jgi:tetraacyldisaccharide 4'-kinase
MESSLDNTDAMYSRTQLLEIISGKRNGFLPTLVRMGCSCVTPIYRVAIGLRNRKFDRAILRGDNAIVQRAGIPVISIGNLTTGGTGKTPHVIWVSKYLRQRNLRVAIVSRGYGSETGRNDEALELESRLPDVPHLQDPDRVRMAQIAEEELESEVLVLDDAYQHRRLHRDLDVVLIDATLPFGYGRLLPRGLLREPVSSLNRADVVVVTRSDLVDASALESIEKRIRRFAENCFIAKTKTTVAGWLQADEKQFPVAHLASQAVFSFSAIGNPSGFRQTISALELHLVGEELFADHHEFTREELVQIGESAKKNGAQAIICTHKDLVKVGTNQLAGIPVFALLINVEFVSGEQEFGNKLDELVDIQN